MDFDQEVMEAKRLLEGGQTVAPAQLHQETLSEPMSTDPPLVKQETDLFDSFDRQVQDAQKILGDSQSKKSFDSWFDTEYSGTKEFLEATGESVVQLGYGALTFLPSYGMGFATMLNEKLKNLLRQDRIDETVRRGGFSEDRFPTDLARKPMVQMLEEAKIKTPAEIKKLVESSTGFFANVMGEPITEGGKKVIGKTGELMDWLFHYPHLADKELTKAGYPNLGYLVGFTGEMLLLKGIHGAAKKGKKVSENVISRYIKTVEDVKKIETPADLKTVSNQVDKILDQLGVTEEQRMIATDKTFRSQRDVGSWVEERARIRKEIPSAKDIRKETEAPGKKEKLVEEAPERLRVRDIEKDRLEAPKEEVKVEEISKPFVHQPNIVGELPKKGELPANRVGEKIYVGEEGELHAEIALRNKHINRTDVETGFVDSKGSFWDYKGGKPRPTEVSQKPFVRKMNVVERFGERVAGEVSDGVQVAKDMKVLDTIRTGIEGKKKVGEIMKDIKAERYYVEDLKDFDYSERDLRSAIRAIKVKEFGDVKIGEEIKTRLEKEAVRRPKTETKPKPAVKEVPRVDLERGRPPGVKADLKKYERPVDVKAEMLERKIKTEAELAPLRTSEGKLVGSKVLAERLAKSRGLVGEIVKTSDGKGWYVKKTKEMRKTETTATKKLWDDLLKEEDLGELKQSDLGKLDQLASAVKEHLWDDTGAIDMKMFKVGPEKAIELLKKIHRRVRTGYIRNVSGSERKTIEHIMYLHTKGKFDADLTYSKGAMWKDFPKPEYKFDKFPQTKDTIQADIGVRIPVEDGKFESIMFDPHYLVKSKGAKSIGRMGERFTRSYTVDALWNYYHNTIKESYRVLKKGGKLVVKIQDATERLHIGSTNEMYNFAIKAGFKPIDKFYYTRKSQLPPAVSAKNIYGGYDIARGRKSVVEFQVYEKPLRSYKHPEASVLEAISESLKSERGAVTISAETVKKLRDKVRGKKVTEADFVAEMLRRRIPRSQILRAFPNAFKETPIVGTSEFLKRRQDPEDFLPRRIVKRKTGRMKYNRLAPAVTRGDAHVVSTFTKDLKAPWAHEKLRIATSEGLFTEMGKKMKETFLYPIRAADKSMTIASTAMARESNRLKKTFRLGTRQKHADRIGIYEIAQQKDGLARLKAQGIKDIPTKLTPKEQTVYDTLQKTYKNLFVEINLARRAIGEQLFPPVENYSAWFHDLSRAVELEKLSPTASLGKLTEAVQRLKTIPTRIDRISRAPGMKGHEKFRAGPETPGYLHLNTFDNFETYAKIANRVIHLGPTTAYMHELLLPRYKLAQNAPNTWNFLSEWLDFQKGIEQIGLVKNAKTRRWIRQGSSNVAVSYITYAWSSALNQISSLPNSAMLIGLPRMIEGLVRMTAKSQFNRASKVSDVLLSRSPETVLMEAGRAYPLFKGKAGRTLSDVWGKTATVGSLPLTTIDNIVAHATWLGAEAQAKRIYKSSKTYQEMPRAKQAKALEDFTKHYADDVVIEAQGSAARPERAPIQRTAEGAAATTLQTFVIANYDLLKRQMLGIGGPKLPKVVRAQRITRLLIGYAAVGYFFDQISMRSPNPRPVKAALEVLDEENWETDLEKYGKMTGAAAKELIEYIPIVGGKLKYGSEIGGPILSELIKVSKGDFTGFWRLVGIRGFSQLLKSYRAYKKEGTDVDIVFGRYVDDED